MPHVMKLLAFSVGAHFTAGIRISCISPWRAADRERSIPAHSYTPAQGASSLESPSSSLFSKPPLSPVSTNAPVGIQSENVASPNRLQLIFYRKGGVRNKNSEVTLLIKRRVGKNINRWIAERSVGHQVRGK